MKITSSDWILFRLKKIDCVKETKKENERSCGYFQLILLNTIAKDELQLEILYFLIF
jgi:hypothetical protein